MKPLVLLTGATGYIGSRLLPRLLESGYRVRCLTRKPSLPAGTPYFNHLDRLEFAQGDLVQQQGLDAAMKGVTHAFYLVHSMASGADYAALDRAAATYFVKNAEKAGLERIVYLGGLAHEDEPLSPHLRSRLEVGAILRSSEVPTLELRASIIIGAQSLSFELLRSLVERLPVMVTPRWVQSRAQPIHVNDVLQYLMLALEVPMKRSRVVEIGGPDVKTYGDLMHEYARIRELRRVIVPVPVLTPALSAMWLGIITPRYAKVGRELIESLRCDTDVRNSNAKRLFSIRPRPVNQAIREALAETASTERPTWRNWIREVREVRAA